MLSLQRYGKSYSRHLGCESEIIVSLGTKEHFQWKYHVRFRSVTGTIYIVLRVKRKDAFWWGPVTIRNQPSQAEITSETKKVCYISLLKESRFTPTFTGTYQKRHMFSLLFWFLLFISFKRPLTKIPAAPPDKPEIVNKPDRNAFVSQSSSFCPCNTPVDHMWATERTWKS